MDARVNDGKTLHEEKLLNSSLEKVTFSERTILPKLTKNQETTELFHDTSERFVDLRVLGEGASGRVFLARDKDINRDVAIKQLKFAHEDHVQLVRFLKEVQITGHLSHPGTTVLYDVGVSPHGDFYLLMKYHPGQTLREILNKLKNGDDEAHLNFPFSERIRIFHQLLQTMSFAHSKGILHRDLKPSNIVIGEYGEVTVMDWGIAKVLDSNSPFAEQSSLDISLQELPKEFLDSDAFETKEQSLLGTLAYMSPEQARGEISHLDERSDIYSLCAIFYELLTLRYYLEDFSESDMPTLWNAILREDPKNPALLDDLTGKQGSPPAEFLFFAMKGLQKEASKRFTSTKQMVASFQRLQEGIIPVQCPITLVRHLTNLFQRMVSKSLSRTILSISMIVLLILAGVVKSIELIFLLI